MNALWLLFLTLSGVAASILFFFAIRKWPALVAATIVVSIVIAWEIPYPAPLVNVLGISVYFLDVLSIAALVASSLRLPQMAQNLGPAFWPWCALGLTLFFSLGAGLLENAFGLTMNEFRSFFYLYGTGSWALSLSWSRPATVRLMRSSALIMGFLLVLVAGYHMAVHGFGSTSAFVDAGTGLEQTTRPLVSSQALMLLLSGMIALWSWRREQRNYLLLVALLFFIVVLLSQQRTVWAVGGAAVLVVFIAGRLGTKALVAAFTAGGLWFATLFLTTGFASDLSTTLSEAVSDSGTYDARVRSWINLIDQSVQEGPASVIFGQPMGSGFGRFEGVGRWVEFAPHNWYLTLFLRVGLVGLCLFLVFLFIVLARLLSQRKSMAALALTVALIVYGWSYSWPWSICLFLGWAISECQADPRRSGVRSTTRKDFMASRKSILVTSSEKRLQL